MEIQVGSILEGKVTGITTFGAFLSLREGKIGLSIKKTKEKERPSRNQRKRGEGFEEKLNRFLKESEDRQSSLKKSGEKKGRSW